MISFKVMWDDVCELLSENKIEDIQIVEKFKSGFIVKDMENTEFVTKDDFVDFWCKILCFNEITKKEIEDEGKTRLKYVYEVVKKLPYIDEKSGCLRITE